ncbi:MAG: chemotaxis protein CheW [Clostridium sp.]|uniref:chemotaxis protein CheW n=1 Tax=Clostridium sp. TaxID=1506 RepID=UPI00290F59F3|nr:chemotaxis protein CheW [Clostridium sp.]MDU7336842.1 chemotaxis protein CheW [Clostridium sp.]
MTEEQFEQEYQNKDELEGRYLTFWVQKQLFGISIDKVVQIVGMQEITELPEQPAYAKGIINLRGQIIPVIDIRLRLGKPEAEYTERTCIIITRINEKDFGLIVDEVDEVTKIVSDRISPPPQMGKDKVSCYLTGIARMGSQEKNTEKVVLLVHPGKLINDTPEIILK